MSWDVLVSGAKSPPPCVADMPDDWHGNILGATDDVRQRITASFPNTDWTDPSWGIFEGDGFSFEFSIGSKDQSDGFMIHVRGGGSAVPSLLKLAESNQWYLLDCSQGEWLHHCTDPEAGWSGFKAYRDRVLGNSSSQSGGSA